FARSMISLNGLAFLRRSIVRVLTPKKAATSSSVHCMVQSFSSSPRSIFASGRAIVTLLLFEQSQLGVPVGERQAQPLEIWMAAQDRSFDLRDLAAAPRHSCRDSESFGFDFVERTAVCIKLGLFAGEVLPALDDDIHVLGVEFDAVAGALGHFGGD